MKILVIGSGGFIGSHLARDLADRFEVRTASTGAGADYRLSPTTPDFNGLLEASMPDVCVSCMGAASPIGSFQSPVDDFNLNVLKLHRLLDAVRVSGRGVKLIHLSSAAVYGNPATLPVREDAAIRPLSPYGWHKAQAEMLCSEYSALGWVGTHSLRIFSAYGPGLKRQLLWDALSRAQGASQLTLFGTGEETRDFIYVSDVSEAIATIASNGAFDGSAVNVAAGRALTIRFVVETLLDAAGWRGELSFGGQQRAGDPLFWQADISTLSRMGFQPMVAPQTGLANFANWFRSAPDLRAEGPCSMGAQ